MYFSISVYEENESIEVNIKGVRLEFVTKFSYLDIVIDSKLQFNDHIKNSIKQAGHKVYMLSKIRQYINKKNISMVLVV